MIEMLIHGHVWQLEPSVECGLKRRDLVRLRRNFVQKQVLLSRTEDDSVQLWGTVIPVIYHIRWCMTPCHLRTYLWKSLRPYLIKCPSVSIPTAVVVFRQLSSSHQIYLKSLVKNLPDGDQVKGEHISYLWMQAPTLAYWPQVVSTRSRFFPPRF